MQKKALAFGMQHVIAACIILYKARDDVHGEAIISIYHEYMTAVSDHRSSACHIPRIVSDSRGTVSSHDHYSISILIPRRRFPSAARHRYVDRLHAVSISILFVDGSDKILHAPTSSTRSSPRRDVGRSIQGRYRENTSRCECFSRDGTIHVISLRDTATD